MNNIKKNINDFNWIGIDLTTPQSNSTLKISADIDFVSLITLWDNSVIQSSVYAWIAKHCIANYCKTLILKNDPTIKTEGYGHNLLRLWKLANNYIVYFKNHKQFNNLIQELDLVVKSLRKGISTINLNPEFLAVFVLLGSALRYEIMGKFDYLNTHYGLTSNLFIPGPNNKNIITEQKIFKIIHLILNHQTTFSLLSVPHEFGWANIEIDTTRLLRINDHFNSCPFCNGYYGFGPKSALRIKEFLDDEEII